MPSCDRTVEKRPEPGQAGAPIRARFHELAPSRQDEFVAQGLKPSLFFAHRYRVLPKFGPDGFKLATRMCGPVDPDAAWEIVLYAAGPQLDEFPAELFFDDDLVWHRQQFGLPGHLATANLVLRGRTLHSMVHISDVVQRIGRLREHKTRIENRFRGWVHMLLNAVMNFALEQGVAEVRTPVSELARTHTDPRRNPHAQMFERIYDRSVLARYRATREGGWWVIGVDGNRDRIVVAAAGVAAAPEAKTICICHDIERGIGHLDVDPSFAEMAERTSRGSLGEMLAIEAAAGVRTTYSVVGTLFAEERSRIEPPGHAVAFHSYDHVVAPEGNREQLSRCRAVDYRVKGYRPPRSLLTAETSDENLLHHNFEWLACSRHPLGFAEPRMHRRLAKIPIAFDDFPLYSKGMAYEAWERAALEEIERRAFIAFGLHDCYAPWWLPHYPRLLERLQALGTLKTFDQVAAGLALANAC